MRVCQPGPVAFQRFNVSCGSLREIEVRAWPDFGRPRGLTRFVATAFPNSSGSTSSAALAPANFALFHVGFSASAFSGFGLRFIVADLTFIRSAQTDDVHMVGATCKYQQMQTLVYASQRLKPVLAVVAAYIFHDQCGVPFELARDVER